MPLYGLCAHPTCLALIELGSRFCSEHERQAAALVRRPARVSEPWRGIYNTPEWAMCRRVVFRRDGHRCTHTDDEGVRCVRKTRLQVHHQIQLVTMWLGLREANPHLSDGDLWPMFLPLATNPDICTSLCPSHHKQADDALRAATNQEWFAKARYAPPRTPASKRHTRRRRGRR